MCNYFTILFISCYCHISIASIGLNITELPILEKTENLEDVTSRPPLIVSTLNGLLRGLTLPTTSENNRSVSAFLGIPYAQPPIGDFRFKPPQDPASWSGLRNAYEQPPSCMQRPDVFFADFQGSKENQPSMPPSEDCLYLNVFVPDLLVRVFKGNENEENDVNLIRNGLPVMIWFHGGSFSSGSSLNHGPINDDWIPDPRELASNGEIIVVTVQYRLGSFGFLFMDDAEAPGNVGLLDQLKAIRWIKSNILAFGGNPDQITLAGQDAGGVMALTSLMIDQDLNIDSIILQSSGIQHPWSFIEPREAFRRTLSLAELVGCPTSTISRFDVIQCLRKVNPEEIINKEMGVVSNIPELNYQPFVLTLDGFYLRMEPQLLLPRLAEKKFLNLKMLIGTNADEGSKMLMYYLPHFFPNEELETPEISSEDFDIILRKVFLGLKDNILETIKFQYTNWTYPDDSHQRFKHLIQLVGDWQYNCPEHYLTESLRNSNIYKYRFEVQNPMDNWPLWTGVKHGAELDYIFGRPLETINDKSDHTFNIRDLEVSQIMMSAWANFVKYGNPNGASRAHHVGWPKYDAKSTSSKHILRIGPYKMLDNTQIITSIIHEDRAEKCAFWNDLFPKLKAMQKKSINDKCPNIPNTDDAVALSENDTNFLPVFYPKKLRKNSKEDFTKLSTPTTNVQNDEYNEIQTTTPTEIQKSSTSTTANPNKTGSKIQESSSTTTEYPNKIAVTKSNNDQSKNGQSTIEKKQTNERKNTKKPKDEIEEVETNLPPIINSLKKSSPLYTDDLKFKTLNKNKFLNDVGTQVSFRMNVKHHNNEDWNFYQSTEAGDDPVVVHNDENDSTILSSNIGTTKTSTTTTTTTTTLTTTTSTTTTTRLTTVMWRKPTWKWNPGVYDPFGQLPKYEDEIKEFSNSPIRVQSRKNGNYYPTGTDFQ